MIEPTVYELSSPAECKATLDAFADALIQIAAETQEQPDLLKDAPHSAPMKRLDEVRSARELVLCRC